MLVGVALHDVLCNFDIAAQAGSDLNFVAMSWRVGLRPGLIEIRICFGAFREGTLSPKTLSS